MKGLAAYVTTVGRGGSAAASTAAALPCARVRACARFRRLSGALKAAQRRFFGPTQRRAQRAGCSAGRLPACHCRLSSGWRLCTTCADVPLLLARLLPAWPQLEKLGIACVNGTEPDACHPGQSVFWFSQGCTPGCKACDHNGTRMPNWDHCADTRTEPYKPTLDPVSCPFDFDGHRRRLTHLSVAKIQVVRMLFIRWPRAAPALFVLACLQHSHTTSYATTPGNRIPSMQPLFCPSNCAVNSCLRSCSQLVAACLSR